MRLLLCLISSALLHAVFFDFRPVQITVPNLSISLHQRNVGLKIITRTKKKEIAPLPQEEKVEVKPPPPPEPKKELAPKPKKKVKKEEKPRRKKEIPLPSKQSEKQSYVSEIKKPRLIERAEYLNNPPPQYPDQARRRRYEGTVTLLVEIDSKGIVSGLQVQNSSGHSLLDRAAREAVKSWRFTPATIGTRQVASKVIVPILFKLR